MSLGIAAAAGIVAGGSHNPLTSRATAELAEPAMPVRLAAVTRTFDPLMDPAFSLGVQPQRLGLNAPVPADLQRPVEAPPPAVVASLPTPQEMEEATQVPVEPAAPVAPSRPIVAMPLPAPRPPGLNVPAAPERPQIALAPAERRRARTAAAAAQPQAPAQDGRNFLERLFGAPQTAPTSALGYASASATDDLGERPRLRLGTAVANPPPSMLQAGTAVYDIRARTVYLPNGERLEAHSGLGDKMDDPRHVHVRMHGATPPHTYILTEREALFHGVRAIRLNPVGGSGAIHGRAGLLAHTYMLGPRGDSNGCISIRDYNRFLQAFLRGEIRRLVVVAGG